MPPASASTSTSKRHDVHGPSPPGNTVAVASTANTRTAAAAPPSSPRTSVRNSSSGTSTVASRRRSVCWPPSIGVMKTCSGGLVAVLAEDGSAVAAPPSSAAMLGVVVRLKPTSSTATKPCPHPLAAAPLPARSLGSHPDAASPDAARVAHQATLAMPSKGATIQSAATPASRQTRMARRRLARATSRVPKPAARPASTAAADKTRVCTSTTPASALASPDGTSRNRRNPSASSLADWLTATSGWYFLRTANNLATQSRLPASPTMRFEPPTKAISNSGGSRSRHSCWSTGISSFAADASTRQADQRPLPNRLPTLVPSVIVRTSRVTSGLPAGSSIGTCPPAAARSPSGNRTPSSRIPCTRRPGGRLSDRLVRPRLSMSKSVSYSVAPEAWHHDDVISRHTHARPSTPPGASSAAATSAESKAVAGSKENSATVTGPASAEADSGGTSLSRRLTTKGATRPTFRTMQWPRAEVVPSTHASSTGVARVNGIVRAARIVTASRAGGFTSTSHRSPPPAPVPPGPVRLSDASSRRAETVPTAGGSSDHSSGSSTGSENCTTIESRSDAAGWHSNVTASVSRSSRTVSRTWVRASRGGRRRTSRAARDPARKPAHIRARAAPSSISTASRPSGPTAWKSACVGSACVGSAGAGRSCGDACSCVNSTVVSGLVRRSMSADRSDSPSSRTMSSSAVEKPSPSAMPARCPVIRRPRPRAGVTAAIKPIRSTSPRVSRSTFQSNAAAGSSVVRRRAASASSAGVGSVMASTESMNQPGVMRAVRSKASPRRTRTSHAARPTTTTGERSTVVTRMTSRSAMRDSNESVTVAPAVCSSMNNRDGQMPGAAPPCSSPPCS